MSAKNRARVTLEFQDGTVIDTWERFDLRESFTDPLGDFSFTMRPSRDLLPHYADITSPGELVKLKINGNQQATMHITRRRRRTDREGVTFELSAKSTLVVPYRASVDPTIATHFTAASPATEVIARAMAPFGFDFVVGDSASDVEVLTGKPLGGKKQAAVNVAELKIKDAEAHDGEAAYGFCARTVLRLGIALRCTHDGTLLATAPNFDQPVNDRLVQDYDGTHAGDRMLDGFDLEEDNESTYSEVIVRGDTPDGAQQKTAGRPLARVLYDTSYTPPDAALKDTPATTIPSHRGSYRSTSQRYKPLIVTDKLASDAKAAVSRGKRILGRSAEKAWVFTCEVDGLISNTGRVWRVDTCVSVLCEDCAIDEPLWVLETTKTGDRQRGQRTKLKLIPLHSLILGDVPGSS